MIKNSVGINPFSKGKQSANACEKVYNETIIAFNKILEDDAKKLTAENFHILFSL